MASKPHLSGYTLLCFCVWIFVCVWPNTLKTGNELSLLKTNKTTNIEGKRHSVEPKNVLMPLMLLI